jgi:L-ascorbate metabolism protein UlaG (beta-lactamase superfamily)
VMEISKRHPNCHFFVPLGNKQWFNEAGINNVTEMDWWEERDVTLSPSQPHAAEVAQPGESVSQGADIKARVGCLPCQHTSARSPFDRDKTLWSSWYVESGGRKVYFAGYVPQLPSSSCCYGPILTLWSPYTGIQAIAPFQSFPRASTIMAQITTTPSALRSNRSVNIKGLLI